MCLRIFCLVVAVLSFINVSLPNTYPEEYIHMAGLFDLRTDFTDGEHTLDEVVQMAKERGYKALFLNEHDVQSLEYGIWPLRNILKIKVSRPSILKNGALRYLQKIREISIRYPEMILVPGSESSPFYYWSGSLIKQNLTACDYERHLLVVNLNRAEDYEGLPVIHNPYILKVPLSRYLIGLAVLAFFLLSSWLLVRKRGLFRLFGIILAVLGSLLTLNEFAFKKSYYDPYKGDYGIAPFQELIDYVNSRGGMVFWNHPETASGQGPLGPIQKQTLPYPQILAESTQYTGFAALYGDSITLTDPGGLWDDILLAYCSGQRKKPIWGISSADFHKDGHAGEKLGNFPTIFLVKNQTKQDMLDALKRGRFYAYRGNVDLNRMELKEFFIQDQDTTEKAVLGEEIQLNKHPKIHILISSPMAEDKISVKVKLIRNGMLLEEFSGITPLKIEFLDRSLTPGGKSYYRLEANGENERILISNPIFVSF